MNYILFIMFLVAPPGKKDPEWTLQSTVSMEFANAKACKEAFHKIQDSIQKTPTIAVSGWCFSKDDENQPTVGRAPPAVSSGPARSLPRSMGAPSPESGPAPSAAPPTSSPPALLKRRGAE